MEKIKAIQILTDVAGEGREAQKGSIVLYNARLYLRHGDEVTRDSEIIARARQQVSTRIIDGVELIDHKAILGKRQVIAGIEKSLYGMKRYGYREVLIAPHLAYGERGIDNLIPANAMLRVKLWLQEVHDAREFIHQ